MATIRKRGNRYHAQIRRRGHPPQTASFATQREANAWARSIESAMDMGQFIDISILRNTRLGELFARYSQEVSPLKRSAHSERLRLKALERDPLATLPLNEVRPKAIAGYRDRRLATGLKPATINKELNLISAVINHARREWDLPIANPVRDVRRPSPGPGRDRRLERKEEERLFDALQRTRNPLLVPIVRFALETAMRRSEILALRWRDIDVARRTARLLMTKNGRPRSVPLSPRALEVLHELSGQISTNGEDPPRNAAVFDTTAEAVKLAFQRAVKRAELEDFHFHDLRHEAISRLVERGDFQILEIASISGHRDLRMLQRYTHLHAASLAEKLAHPAPRYGAHLNTTTSHAAPAAC